MPCHSARTIVGSTYDQARRGFALARATGRFACVAAILAAFAGSTPRILAQPKGDPAEWAPSDALVYVGVADTTAVWDDVKKTAAYKMMSDEELKKVAGAVPAFIEELKKHLATVVEVAPEQLENPFGGPAAMFIRAPASRKLEEAKATVVIGVGKPDLMKKYYASAIKKLRDAAKSHESVSAGSNNIDAFTGQGKKDGKKPDGDGNEAGPGDHEGEDGDGHGDEDLPAELQQGDWAGIAKHALKDMLSPDSMPDSFAMCLTSDRLVYGHDADAVKAALKSLDKSDSLAGSDEYRALLKQFESTGPVRWLVNIPRMIELAKDSEEDSKMFAALGFKAIRGLIGHAKFGGADFETRVEMMLLTSGEPTGLVKILSMKNTPVSLPASVPAAASFALSLNLDVPATLDEVEKILRQTDPDEADRMHAGLEAMPLPNGETLNIRKDFLDHLRAPLALSMGFAKPYAADSLRLMLSLGHRSREAVDKFLAAVAQPPMLTPRELRGTQVYDITMAGASLAASSDALMVGNTQSVEAALAGGVEGLGADASFKKAAKMAPAEAWLTLYGDGRRMMEGVLGMVENKDSQNSAEAGGPMAMIGMEIARAWTGGPAAKNPELLKKALKYYAPTIATVSTASDGLKLSVTQLKPEEK